jgi:hypothetical protein
MSGGKEMVRWIGSQSPVRSVELAAEGTRVSRVGESQWEWESRRACLGSLLSGYMTSGPMRSWMEGRSGNEESDGKEGNEEMEGIVGSTKGVIRSCAGLSCVCMTKTRT